MSLFSTHHLNRSAAQLASLAAIVALLYAAAVVGMAYVAGFGAVHHRLADAQWWWLAPAFGSLLVGFGGYFFAYRGIKWVERGSELEPMSTLAFVTAAFGGFLAHGGTALDELAMRAGGADEREARIRVAALSGFEQAVLALIVCPAAIVAVAAGVASPRPGFTWPWAVIPPPAFVVVIWLAERYRYRLRRRHGWRRRVGMFFDAVHLVYTMVRHPRRHGVAVAGMALYWGGEMFSLWAATAAFGFQMTALQVIVAIGTGMILTRRTAPLAGAGVMVLALVPTLWYGSGVPFAAATLGVAAYRLFTVWVPLPGAIAAVPKLRELSAGRAAALR